MYLCIYVCMYVCTYIWRCFPGVWDIYIYVSMVNTGAHTRMPHSTGKGAKQGRATATRDEAAATGRPGKHTSVDVALPLSTPPDAWTPTALSTRSRTLSAANARNRANPICQDSDDNDRPGFKEKRRYIIHGKAQYGDAVYFISF